MKKIAVLFGILLVVNTTHSQMQISLLLGDKLNNGKIEFGLKDGDNWSTIYNLENGKSLRNFNLGFYFDFKFKNPALMLNTSVIVKSTIGADKLPVYSKGNEYLDKSLVEETFPKG